MLQYLSGKQHCYVPSLLEFGIWKKYPVAILEPAGCSLRYLVQKEHIDLDSNGVEQVIH